jgi:hypothetical protein
VSGAIVSGVNETSAGFSVLTDELTGYASSTHRLAGDLHRLATHTIAPVRTIAEDSFGRIGKDTGFGAALGGFAHSLQQQIAGVATNASTLGDAVAKTAHTYQRQDEALAKDVLDLLNRGLARRAAPASEASPIK